MPGTASQNSQPIYLQLADVLEGMIRSNSLRPGDRMPSVRQFGSQQGVSIPTAMSAYASLEARGCIEVRPKSGFFVRARDADQVREPWCDAQECKVTEFANIDPMRMIMADHNNPKFIPLGAGVPSASLLPGLKLARIMGAIARQLPSAGLDYDVAPGSEILRRELARRSLDWGCKLKADDFVITNGCTEAVALALRVVCEPGDTVIVESPTYFGLASMLSDQRLKALPLPVDSLTGIDLNAVKKAIKKRKISACVLIPNFHNPVGCTMPIEHKREIVRMMSEAGIPIIEDDIYGDIQHQGPRPRALKAFDQDGTVLLCSSVSKTLAPGYRVGYIAPGKWKDRICTIKDNTTLSNALLPTLAVAEFLRHGGYDRHLRTLREAYRQQTEKMRTAIVQSFPAEIGLSRPMGNFLLWCELPKKVDSLELFKLARAAGISVAPGPLFSPNGGYHNFIRINCGQPWTSKIERSVAVLGHLVKQLAVS